MLNLKRIESLLLFLTILFLPTQFGKHFWPQFSFVYSLPIDYLSPTLYFWDLLVILLCLVFILRRPYVNRLALNLFFIFILSQSLSLFTSFSNLGVGLVRLEQYFIAGLFGVYIASSKKIPISSAVFWGLSIGIIFESILAIIQFLKTSTLGLWIFGERTFSISTPGISKFDYHGREFLRPYATFPHPNVLAGFMVLSVVILNAAKSLWHLPKENLSKIADKAATVFASGAILLTMSRVAIIAALVFATTVSIKNRYKILMVIALIILLPVLYTRFSSLLNFDSLTLVRREELSLVAIKLWKTSPFFGVGLNNFIPTASDLLLSGPSRFLQPVHDIFLLALSETGILGLLGLISLAVYPLFKMYRSKNRYVYQYSILLVWITVTFLGLFDHYFLTLPQGYRLLFFVWGLSLRVLE